MSVIDQLERSQGLFKKKGGLLAQLQRDGRFPPVELQVKPLNGDRDILITQFLSYEFNSSVLVPIDSFSFNFAAPDSPTSFDKIVKSGDIALLTANGFQIGKGIIDQTEIATESDSGEQVSVAGRDLLSQLEDQQSVSIDHKPIWGNKMTPKQAFSEMIKTTRISERNLAISSDTPTTAYLFATEPGETKINALQRYCEGLNIMFWMTPDGRLYVGRPNMNQRERGRLFINKAARSSNVLSMTVTRSHTSIPNIIIPVWAGQEFVQEKVAAKQAVYNAKPRPARLRKMGHVVSRAVIVSTPEGSSPQDLSDVNKLRTFGGDLLEGYAKREVARQNTNGSVVQAVVAGHYNENGEPYLPDTNYKIEYDRGNVDEKMYCFGVKYSLSEGSGQTTTMLFCQLGTILADIQVPT